MKFLNACNAFMLVITVFASKATGLKLRASDAAGEESNKKAHLLTKEALVPNYGGKDHPSSDMDSLFGKVSEGFGGKMEKVSKAYLLLLFGR